MGPDDVALGRSWGDEDEAAWMAEILQMAFDLGRSVPYRAEAPVSDLEGMWPVVLYFYDSADRDDFVAAIAEVKHGMRLVKL